MRAISFAVAVLAAAKVSAEESSNNTKDNAYYLTPEYPHFMGQSMLGEPRFQESSFYAEPNIRYVVEEPQYIAPKPRYVDPARRYVEPMFEEPRPRYIGLPR